MKPCKLDVENVDDIQYPVFVLPKIDGIRCTIVNGIPLTASGKRIANEYVRKKLTDLDLPTYDGELVVGAATDPDVFNRTQRGIMSRDGEPEFTFHVFDIVDENITFYGRSRFCWSLGVANWADFLRYVPAKRVENPVELKKQHTHNLAEGYEGSIVRSISGHYKHGRATVKEASFFKIKTLPDAEAHITGYEMSTKHAGISALLVRDEKTKIYFKIGSGFSMQERLKFAKEALTGKLPTELVTYQYMSYGTDKAPRHPVFKGLRNIDDTAK